MVVCPECNHDQPDNGDQCLVCGHELPEAGADDWLVLGTLENKVFADLAREALVSSNIPAVLRSKDGFFGSIGLPLHPFYGGQSASFEILVPAACRSDAEEVLNMTVGDKWRRKEG